MKSLLLMLSWGMINIIIPCQAQQLRGDVNCDGVVNIKDITYSIKYLYLSGTEPCDFIAPQISYLSIDHIPYKSFPGNAWGNIAQLTVNIPVSGDIHISAQCVENNYSGTSFVLGLDTTANGGSISYPGVGNPFELGIPQNNYGQDLNEVISIAPGTYTFYYNLYSNDQPREHEFFMVKIIATFYPIN